MPLSNAYVEAPSNIQLVATIPPASPCVAIVLPDKIARDPHGYILTGDEVVRGLSLVKRVARCSTSERTTAHRGT